MYEAARDAGVVHMTAFTYRFAPSMRYLRHLLKSGALGTPRHFRSQRFLDWPETSWGWRQYKDAAGAGDLFDMTIHRIDFAHRPAGPDRARLRRRRPVRPSRPDRRRQAVPSLGRRRLVVPDRRVRQRARPASGREPRWPRAITATASATNGPRSTARKARPSTACTSPTRSCWARPGQDLAPGARARRVPQAGRQPARPGRGRTRDRLPLRPDVGVHLGDRRAAPGRAQLLRRPERPDRRRRRARVARAGERGSTRRWRRGERAGLSVRGVSRSGDLATTST